MSRLFISYRRADSPDTVKLFTEQLKTRLPRWEVFYDHHSIKPGEPFPDRLREEVRTAIVVLVIIGPRWLEFLRARKSASVDHVREEIRLALTGGNIVIPITVGNAVLPSTADLAEFPDLLPLAERNASQVRPEPDFDADLSRLGDYLERIGPREDTGTVLVGKYKLLQEIGRGGMGVVYRAEQIQPRRSVAVKMVLQGMDTKEILARFDAERQALAVMDHPNIAKVLDAGTAASGRPYFVMELVKGEPITEYSDRNRMVPSDRLRLFKQVCEAVQHAHQKGIIHRDIKPSNVLVEVIDGRPVPKVIDFGLAKALGQRLTDKTLVSEMGKVVGTLVYSSPEQAAGRTAEIDTRTDIYSLGVLLYELLVGEPPFTQTDLQQVGEEAIKQAIIHRDPSKPSAKLSSSAALPTIAANRQLDPAKLERAVRGDLDWIVMKTLEKDPRRRYATATSLAEDVERHLHHEPVSAGKPTLAYRLHKFLRRNRGSVIAASVILAVLLISFVGITFALWEAKHQEALAKEESEQKAIALRNEEVQHKLADQRFAEKRQAMDRILEEFSDTQLNSLPGTQEIRKVLFSRGVEQYESMFRDNYSDRAVQHGLTDGCGLPGIKESSGNRGRSGDARR